MLSPRWKKVIRDLWMSKTRTLLVVLSIAVGVFAFGTVIIARDNLLRELHQSFLATNPVSATLTTEPFDDDLVEVVRRLPAVGAAEGQRRMPARIAIGPGVWYDMDLIVLPDDGSLTVNTVRPGRGPFPPPDTTLLVERSSLAGLNAAVGDTVVIELAGGEQRSMQLAGLAHDLSLPPAPVAGKAFGYVTFDTLEWLGGPRTYNDLHIVVAEHPLDTTHIWDVAAQVSAKLERSGREVLATDVPPPQQHPAESIIPSILLILAGLGGVSLVLGVFLIINTIEAILTQQIRQIGMMKAIGARTNQIASLYLGMVLVFGLLALLLAMPLGLLAARGFTGFMAIQLNIDVQDFRMPLYVLVLMTGAALLLPVLAALPSIWGAGRMTVREAISSAGTAAPAAASESTRHRLLLRLSSLLAHWLGRPLLLSLRNTFRRKGRLLRALAVLTLGGAIFISVLTVRASLFASLDATTATKRYDIEVRLARPYRAAELVPQVQGVPGVVYAEGWYKVTAHPLRADGSEAEQISLYALPPDTTLLDLDIATGRWLLPDDDGAIVLSANYLTKEPGTRVGDALTLTIDGDEHTWRIVGFSDEFISPVNPAIGYVSYTSYTRAAGGYGQMNTLEVVTASSDGATQAQVAHQLEALFDQRNTQVRLVRTTYEDQALLYERFNVLTAILSLMAALIGTVGGLGLMGMMSINVIERTKEIGIMRAVGASDGAVQRIIIAEGVCVGLMAWVCGSLLSLPISYVMSMQIGLQLLSRSLTYTYAASAVGLWLVLVLVVALLASYLPARSAARLTVREVLAYE